MKDYTYKIANDQKVPIQEFIIHSISLRACKVACHLAG